ncbi:MAG: hypothetical protein IJI67_04460 [Clostridia bacterium]|nr:hypothetical protein [Clostridia bacterium]
MNYQRMLTIIAKENGTTPKDVEREMQQAVFAAGYLMSPRAFIAMCCAKVKESQENNTLSSSSF